METAIFNIATIISFMAMQFIIYLLLTYLIIKYNLVSLLDLHKSKLKSTNKEKKSQLSEKKDGLTNDKTKKSTKQTENVNEENRDGSEEEKQGKNERENDNVMDCDSPTEENDSDNEKDNASESDTESTVSESSVDQKELDKALKLNPHETLLVFDWDDTLFPTYALCKLSLMDMLESNEEKSIFNLVQSVRMVERCIINVLNASLELGKVVIISNGSEKWIEKTANIFVENAFEFMKDFDIDIISARDMSSEDEDNEYTLWKRNAISRVIDDYSENEDGKKISNIITIGDSEQEHIAVEQVAQSIPGCFTKKIWVETISNPVQHSLQLLELTRKLSDITLEAKNMTIKLES